MFSVVLALSLSLISGLGAPQAEAQAIYTMTELETLGGNYSFAYAINDAGQVVGTSRTEELYPDYWISESFLWTPAGGMQGLGTLGSSDANIEWGFDINSAGQVVGTSRNAASRLRAYLRTEGGTDGPPSNPQMRDLGHLGAPPGGDFSWGHGINDLGHVVGRGYYGGRTRAFLWTQAGGMQVLGTLGGYFSIAEDINDAGQIVGRSYVSLSYDSWHAFLWTAAGGMQDLGTLGGERSWAEGINDAGQIVGGSDTGDGVYHAFVWTPGGTDGVPTNPQMRDLGTLGGDNSHAYGINSGGQIVGGSQVLSGQWRAYIAEKDGEEIADPLVFAYSTQPRPGFDMEYTILYHNRGTGVAKNVKVIEVLPATTDVTFLWSDPPYWKMDEINGRTRLQWKLGDLSGGEGGVIKVAANVQTSVPLGTVLESETRIWTASKQETTANDIHLHQATVIGSWDPNDKGVTPQGFIEGHEDLFYVVHYENEGTADAIHITVTDELSDKLDDTTLVIINDGGTYDPETRTITWELRNIYLPPGETDAVYFVIRAVEGLDPGTEIRNKASIVFDFNPPMDTPETVTIIGTEEQLELQDTARNLIMSMQDMEEKLLELVLSDPDMYFSVLDDGIDSAWQAFEDVNNGDLPWPSFNECQARLEEFRTLIQESDELPLELVDQWTEEIDNELTPSIVDQYPPEPLAMAGEDQTVECAGPTTMVTLDGSASYDPNPSESIESYTWHDEFYAVVGTTVDPALELELGLCQFTLVVNDGAYDSEVVDDGTENDSVVNITVMDTKPPQIACPADAVEECESAGQAYVSLLLATASDICCETVTITNDNTPNGPDASGSYPLGDTVVVFTACDPSGNCSSCQTAVTVVDTTPPDLLVDLTPNTLWPPNHRMIDIGAQVVTSDLCSTPLVVLKSVQSNEPDNAEGNGDGNTVNDIQDADAGTADFGFQLRAERAGTGEGRTYTVVYSATDSSGNVETATASVFVAHDQGGVTEPLMISVHQNGLGLVVEWEDVPGALFYNVVRGELKNLQEKNDSYHLGPVACVASGITQTSTAGFEDPDSPPMGGAFFYLVEYNDGLPSGYGTESADKERFMPPGQGCP